MADPQPPASPAEALAAELPKFLGHPDDLADRWMDESYENAGECAWDREAMEGAYREGRDEARRQLAAPWDALAAERDRYRAVLTEVLDDLEHVVSGNAGYIDRDMLEDYRDRAVLEAR